MIPCTASLSESGQIIGRVCNSLGSEMTFEIGQTLDQILGDLIAELIGQELADELQDANSSTPSDLWDTSSGGYIWVAGDCSLDKPLRLPGNINLDFQGHLVEVRHQSAAVVLNSVKNASLHNARLAVPVSGHTPIISLIASSNQQCEFNHLHNIRISFYGDGQSSTAARQRTGIGLSAHTGGDVQYNIIEDVSFLVEKISFQDGTSYESIAVGMELETDTEGSVSCNHFHNIVIRGYWDTAVLFRSGNATEAPNIDGNVFTRLATPGVSGGQKGISSIMGYGNHFEHTDSFPSSDSSGPTVSPRAWATYIVDATASYIADNGTATLIFSPPWLRNADPDYRRFPDAARYGLNESS